eukprot:m.184118 g.184118  ORF g.184118 m.184118 type:complete len:744 (+) comp21539_c0_seq4:85-2316(+)
MLRCHLRRVVLVSVMAVLLLTALVRIRRQQQVRTGVTFKAPPDTCAGLVERHDPAGLENHLLLSCQRIAEQDQASPTAARVFRDEVQAHSHAVTLAFREYLRDTAMLEVFGQNAAINRLLQARRLGTAVDAAGSACIYNFGRGDTVFLGGGNYGFAYARPLSGDLSVYRTVVKVVLGTPEMHQSTIETDVFSLASELLAMRHVANIDLMYSHWTCSPDEIALSLSSDQCRDYQARLQAQPAGHLGPVPPALARAEAECKMLQQNRASGGKRRALVILQEEADISLKQLPELMRKIDSHQMRVNIWRSVLFEVVFTFAQLQRHLPGFRHNDLNWSNIRLTVPNSMPLATTDSEGRAAARFGTGGEMLSPADADSTPCTKFIFDELSFFVPKSGFSARLIDFDFTTVEGRVTNSKVQEEHQHTCAQKLALKTLTRPACRILASATVGKYVELKVDLSPCTPRHHSLALVNFHGMSDAAHPNEVAVAVLSRISDSKFQLVRQKIFFSSVLFNLYFDQLGLLQRNSEFVMPLQMPLDVQQLQTHMPHDSKKWRLLMTARWYNEDVQSACTEGCALLMLGGEDVGVPSGLYRVHSVQLHADTASINTLTLEFLGKASPPSLDSTKATLLAILFQFCFSFSFFFSLFFFLSSCHSGSLYLANHRVYTRKRRRWRWRWRWWAWPAQRPSMALSTTDSPPSPMTDMICTICSALFYTTPRWPATKNSFPKRLRSLLPSASQTRTSACTAAL